MDNKPKNENQNQIQIELSPEVAKGLYSNLAIISHGPSEFFLDFINLAPNMPKANVQSRVIMTPENAKNLMFALTENIKKYEAMFGEIKRKMPKNNPTQGNPGDLPNPFIMGGNA
ncbi:MAG: DUF3467 domain-containing protein [Firmicutes bacterium]|nr:DUF3467 domain-containing protein [Bacillota bacterium]MCM1400465.1 DUF3467 domain-containing protein [Bacteroides sp.]MCM1477436.1 DUF3467 domain-containing protein [Bacteroides sp.]